MTEISTRQAYAIEALSLDIEIASRGLELSPLRQQDSKNKLTQCRAASRQIILSSGIAEGMQEHSVDRLDTTRLDDPAYGAAIVELALWGAAARLEYNSSSSQFIEPVVDNLRDFFLQRLVAETVAENALSEGVREFCRYQQDRW